MKKVDGKTNIIGLWNGTIDDLIRPFLTGGDIVRARRIAPMYIKYCKMFNIRADIAFAQMCHETGKLTFKGIAKGNWNNFAGLGITGAGAKQTFADEDLGVIAHIAHLAWYVYPDHVHSLCSNKFDPRHFEQPGKHHPKYNGDTTLGNLSGKYAVPGKYLQPDGSWITYDMKIAKYANIINNAVEEIPEPIILLQRGDKGEEVKKLQKYLTSVGFYLVVDGDYGPRTEGAVKAFQKRENLEITGYVNDITKKKMNDFVVVEPEKLDLIVQMGHVGIYKGMTGTAGEREWNQKLGDVMRPLLEKSGLKYKIIGGIAPENPYHCKVFLSLHADGSNKPSAHGYTMGFKPGTNEKFKDVMSKSYGKLTNFYRRKENSTGGLRLYYMWTNKSEYSRSRYTEWRIFADYYCLVEHAFFTNPKERKWLEENIDLIAKHHIDLVMEFLNDKNQKT